MALSETFRKALEQKDIRMVRIIIKDSLVVDPTFTEMEEMLREAARFLYKKYGYLFFACYCKYPFFIVF